MATSGEPLPDGRVLRGNDSLEIVSIMQSQTPFTTSKPLRDYMADVLKTIEGENAKLLPEENHAAATEFLTRLGSHGLIEFLPEESLAIYPARFCQVMEAIRRSGLTNMLDRKAVGQIAQEMGFEEIADWIRTHRREFAEFILGGRIKFINESNGKEGKPCADR
jgi:hypothetical protein